jgi:CheY-like chemotaxis protein
MLNCNYLIYQLSKSGAEGLEHVGKQKFHLIFMDTSMPRLKGPEATKHIREAQNPFMETTDEQVQENRKYNSTIPIISISSEVSEEDRLRYKQVGMNACFPKPFMRKNLKSVISGVGVELQERSGATTPLSSSLSSPRSLLSPTTALTRSLSEG